MNAARFNGGHLFFDSLGGNWTIIHPCVSVVTPGLLMDNADTPHLTIRA